jgi:phosphoglycolate phosphatase-like HAD superfamily hydrolase
MPEKTRAAATTDEARSLAQQMREQVQQLAFALEAAPEEEASSPLLKHPLKQFISRLKKFAAALEVLSEKLDALSEIAEYEAVLDEKYRECDAHKQEILRLHEQLRQLSQASIVGEVLSDA